MLHLLKGEDLDSLSRELEGQRRDALVVAGGVPGQRASRIEEPGG